MQDFQIRRIRELRERCYSQRQTATELGINRRTVRKYWNAGSDGDATPRTRKRHRVLEPFAQKVIELYAKHRNCRVVSEELEKDKEIPSVALRTIQEFIGSSEISGQPLQRE